MSLRLLLADESSSIKKAFELALQDYQVKIQTVHQGIDVQEIFENFQPDICFMDIMLPKLSGYDTCKLLKEQESSKNTPVVLMWSGFMELDANRFDSCGADESIEKPFETKTLRDIVQNLLPQLGQNEISNHLIMEDEPKEVSADDFESLELPDLPADLEASPDLPPLDPSLFGQVTSSESTDPGVLKDLNSDEPEIDMNLPDIFAMENENDEESEEWTEQQPSFEAPEGMDDLDSFSVEPLSAMTEDSNDSLPFEAPEGLDLPPTPDHQVTETNSPQPLVDEIEATAPEEPLKEESELVVGNNTQIPQLSKEELKRLILAQSKDIIESVVWDVVPELAKEMIQKEIRRLTGEVKHESDLR